VTSPPKPDIEPVATLVERLQEAVKPDLAQKEQDQLYHAAKLWKDGGHGSLPRDIVESWVDANNALLAEAASALLALEGERDARGQEAFTLRNERDDARRSAANWLRLHGQEEARAEAAEAEVARLREALEPFVKLAEGEPDTVMLRTDSREFRRARAALSSSEHI
jgi:hypothetical protein